MIFVHDKGRLCNNILQYGHVFAWGREHGRSTMSMRFAYKYPYFHICDTRYHNFLTYLFAKYGAKTKLLPLVTFYDDSDDTSAQEQAMLSHRNAVVDGWYARWYDLFLKYKQDILNLFAFKKSISAKTDAWLSTLPASDILLGVHIRRGDYKRWQGGRFYYSDAQYIASIARFLSLKSDKKVVVVICGNDPELDKCRFVSGLPDAAAVVFPDGNPGEDLCVLSRCNFLMGAPSTFSLVASMYHDTPLYWMEHGDAGFTLSDFCKFDDLFRRIL